MVAANEFTRSDLFSMKVPQLKEIALELMGEMPPLKLLKADIVELILRVHGSDEVDVSVAERSSGRWTPQKPQREVEPQSNNPATSRSRVAGPVDPYADIRSALQASIDAELEAYERTGAHPAHPQITAFSAFTTYLGYAVLIMFGHLRDFFGTRIFRNSRYMMTSSEKAKTTVAASSDGGYSVLLKSWENFYTRRMYHRIQDCFNRPVGAGGASAGNMEVYVRESSDNNKTLGIKFDDDHQQQSPTKIQEPGVTFVNPSDKVDAQGNVTRTCLNLGSYNYLGFADDWKVSCRTEVLKSLTPDASSSSDVTFPISCSAPRLEPGGTTALHIEVERTLSRFMGKEDCIALSMGFATNSTTIPIIAKAGDLIISDELNHTSIVAGARASGATIRLFKHNDTTDLAKVIEDAIVMGKPRSRRPWGKIIVMVEGIYSMEGEYCALKGIVEVCKRFRVYLYLDEAHSVGAMGPTGRGCCEYCGVHPKDY
jgi:serine palmitoyltransferase